MWRVHTQRHCVADLLTQNVDRVMQAVEDKHVLNQCKSHNKCVQVHVKTTIKFVDYLRGKGLQMRNIHSNNVLTNSSGIMLTYY